jgi:hypothetical protein
MKTATVELEVEKGAICNKDEIFWDGWIWVEGLRKRLFEGG